jgi:hypothetical protein
VTRDAQEGGRALRDPALVSDQAPLRGLDPSGFDPARALFEARRDPNQPWVWEIWDVEHPAECNHFPAIRVDSKGASDDFHEPYARICAEALSDHYSRREGGSAGYDATQVLAAEIERDSVLLGLVEVRACFGEGESDYASIQAAIDFIRPSDSDSRSESEDPRSGAEAEGRQSGDIEDGASPKGSADD